ncbi:hypothetical protein DDP54_10410 [Cellulomonas sp. WB94]|uniref:outer membrane protein assembly factor BamB family protein n=1 Tax=Cellulomonas sp. WB94 TaxID=2173174 RepID=UPI000D587E63|nr:PQQ-binding-like beta-propeller repeat protein [Cellulomonas sp. WB94]PVU83337.1 hypothetical protein DDP54_10410 [Cellulomonas sp. WB94]
MGREAMQQVELSDDSGAAADADTPDAGTTTGSGTTTDPAAARRWMRRRRWAVAVAATVVVGLVGTQVVLDARERARAAHVASIPGVLAPVDASIHTLWSSSDWSTFSALTGVPFGDVMIGGYLDETGDRTVRAIRPRKGEVVWSTLLSAADPAAQAGTSGTWPSCTLDARPPTPQVVCLVSDGAVLGSADGVPTAVAATFARLVVLDPVTGEVLAQHDEPASSAAWVAVLDGVAIVASRSSTGHLVVVGEDPRTGDEQWRFESPLPLAPALPNAWSQDPSGFTLGVVADQVAVTASGGEVWVLSSAGDVIDQEPAGSRTGLEVLRAGLIGVVDYDTSTPTGRSMRIVGRDASMGIAADQQPITLSVDDGSVPNLLFTSSDRLVAWDMTTWDIAWASSVAADTTAVLLDGRLYARSSGGHVLALDAATGATLWEVSLGGLTGNPVYTDGRSILAPETLATGSRTLVALAPVDGHRVWEAPLPDSITNVWQLGRHLIGTPDGGGPAVVLG